MHLVLSVVAALLSAQPPASTQAESNTAQQPQEPAIFTGATLHQACAPANAPESANVQVCRAYILGAADALLHLQNGDDRPEICFPRGLTGKDITGPIARHIDQHPETHSRAAAAIVRELLVASYPCGERTSEDSAQSPAEADAAEEVSPGTPILGVQVTTVTGRLAAAIGLAKPRGAMVVATRSRTEAGRRLRAVDVIMSLNGEAVADADSLIARVRRERAGSRVRLGIWRDGRIRDVQIRLVAAPAAAETEARLGPLQVTQGPALTAAPPQSISTPLAGMTFRTATAEEARSATGLGKGHSAVSVVKVITGSDAEAAGIYATDLLVEIDRHPLRGAEHAAQLLRQASSRGRPILIKVHREGIAWYTAVEPAR